MRWFGTVVAAAVFHCVPAPAIEIVILTGPEGSVEHEEIGPRIADVIRPVAERHGSDVHDIRLDPSTGTAETLARCGRETRTFCLGIARAGMPVDLPEEQRPLILRSDLDRACAVFIAPAGRYGSWSELRDRAAEARFVVHPGSDAEGLLRTLFDVDPALAGVSPRLVDAGTRWPSDILGRIARTEGGVGLFYGQPAQAQGLLPRAFEKGYDIFGLQSLAFEEAVPGFERERRLSVGESGPSDGPTRGSLCAPMLLVSSDPDRLSDPFWDEVATWHRRQDLRDMLEELDWALAEDLKIGPEPPPLDAACAALAPYLDGADSISDAISDARSLLHALGIRAVAHSSGQWIVTAGGAYVAGTIGFLGTTVAVLSAPWITPAVGFITLAGYGMQATCAFTSD